MKIPAEVRTKINKMAHTAGLVHGEQVKLRLMADAELRLAAGESIAEIREYLELSGALVICPSACREFLQSRLGTFKRNCWRLYR